MKQDEALKKVEEIVNRLSQLLLIDSPKSTVEEEDGKVIVRVMYEGEQMGYMIGPRGRHLQSLQTIVSMIVNKDLEDENRIDILLDAGGYNNKRAERIEQIALRKAEDARILGSSVDMDPMDAFERRVVHTVLSKYPDIKTESFGEGRDRYVRISLNESTENEISK